MINETRNTASITSKVWSFCNPLLDVGVGYGDYLEQQKGKLASQSQVEVLFKEDTVWLSQEQIVKLFERDQSVISRHINNVFKEGGAG
ncbi:MAG: hypothetical protein WCI51_12600 [Lentisphaerota bacterium]